MTDSTVKVTAADLRQRMAELEAEKARILAEKRHRAEAAMNEVTQSFTREHLTPDEAEEIREKVRHAVDNGLFEVLVMRFPSRLCSDRGRAVNNALPDWPETLPQKARDLYEGWKATAQPAGFHLRATILDFPGGMPGDVGLFLNWAE